ncbi:MAG: hypothetical protein ACM3UU_00490 [Ignavibacteriales bacterium]
MKCDEFKQKVIEFLSEDAVLPNDLKSHVNECKTCKEFLVDSKLLLKSFKDKSCDVSNDMQEVETFITSINPLLNKKSLQIKETRQTRKESIALALITIFFIGLILFALYSYLINGSLFLIALLAVYTLFSSIISLIFLPTIRKYRRNVL